MAKGIRKNRLVSLDMEKKTPSRVPGARAAEETQPSPSLSSVLWEQRDAADHMGSGLAAIHVHLFTWVRLTTLLEGDSGSIVCVCPKQVGKKVVFLVRVR